ncbi:YraN family protein [Patescibacteria group bacterium]|nr:YraN family protein [Patescibacteria group bacterium]
MSRTEKQKLGDWGEEQAALFLIRNDYQIVERNFTIHGERGKKVGEIDIIARQNKHHFGDTLCFVEVKTRSYGEGSAERATKKENKMISFKKTAWQYCLNNNIDLDSNPIQFEQVSVYLDKRSSKVNFKKYEIPIE